MRILNLKKKLKFSLYHYIEFTSVLMVFLQGFVIIGLPIIDLKLYYVFLISNTLFFLIKYGLRLNQNIVLIFFLLTLHGVFTYFVYSTPFIFFIKQIIGVFIAVLFFYNFFRLFNINRLFNIYLKLSLASCIIALVFHPFGILDKELSRMDGLMTEPSKFIVVLIPALFYFIKEKKIVQSFILVLSFLLAQSSLGYIAIIFIVLLLLFRKETIKYLGLTLIPLFFMFIFLNENELFQLRFQSTIENIEVFNTKKFPEDVNLSTYALMKNAYISLNNAADHPIGTGLGSFGYKHDYYIKELKLPPVIKILGFEDINKEDASSLFLRLISDLGVFGLIIVIVFIFIGISAHFKDYNAKNKTICIGMFIYFLIKLIRMGHYFPEEMYFFLFMFLYSLPKIKLKQIK